MTDQPTDHQWQSVARSSAFRCTVCGAVWWPHRPIPKTICRRLERAFAS